VPQFEMVRSGIGPKLPCAVTSLRGVAEQSHKRGTHLRGIVRNNIEAEIPLSGCILTEGKPQQWGILARVFLQQKILARVFSVHPCWVDAGIVPMCFLAPFWFRLQQKYCARILCATSLVDAGIVPVRFLAPFGLDTAALPSVRQHLGMFLVSPVFVRDRMAEAWVAFDILNARWTLVSFFSLNQLA